MIGLKGGVISYATVSHSPLSMLPDVVPAYAVGTMYSSGDYTLACRIVSTLESF